VSSQIDILRSPVIPTLMEASGSARIPELVPGQTIRVIVEELALGIDAQILSVDRWLEKTGEVSLQVEIAKSIEGKIVLSGKYCSRGLEISSLMFQLWPTQQPAEVAFVASTLNAALKLSRKVRIQVREIGLDLALTAYDSPLLEASNLLRERQTAYRLMVIERATGIDFGPLPSTISGEDVATISFIYHAIAHRTFVDGIRSVEVTTPANEEGFELLDRLKNSPVTFPNENISVSKKLFGREVTLGPQTVSINDPYIENLDRVQEETARQDGHAVRIIVRSLTNRAQYSLSAAPTVPTEPWGPTIQMLINLEGQLDSKLLESYNAMAAGSLAGLTEEEKQLVTQPSDIPFPF